MASGQITLSYTTISNGATSATVRVTMTYYGNGETWNSSPSSNNCYITLNSTTKYFTHAYTTSTSAQTMGYADFTITKTHNTQSLTATGGITNYSTVYSNPTRSCTVSVSAKTSYTISYKANGHGTAPAAQTKWYEEGLVLQDAMSVTDWTFIGWNIYASSTSARYNAGGYYTANAAATLYGIWKKDITLSYNANSGSGAPASQTNTIYNTTTSTSFVIPSTPPTRTNYDFLGWLDGSTLYQPGDTISNVTDYKELVASWELAYIPPQITSLEGKRLENNNSQATITINWTKGNDGNDINTTKLSIAYKLSTSSTWTYVTNTTGNTSSTETWISSTNTTYSTTVKNLTDSQYDIQIKVRNSNYTSYTQTKTSFISATFYVIDITADGKGIGLLTTAPSGGINIGGQLNFINTSIGNNPLPICLNGHNAIFHNQGSLQWNNGANSNYLIDKYTLAYWNGTYDGTSSNLLAQKVDYITKQGTNSSWTYRIWNSGIKECWINTSFPADGSTGAVEKELTLPITFNSTGYTILLTPGHNATVLSTPVRACDSNGNTSSKTTTKFKISAKKDSNYAVGVHIYVIGI